jgi:DNA-binding transcriptional regulator GbsR (MarR family)
MAAKGSARGRLDEAQRLGIDTCARIAQFWGFTRTMGRTFGLLYLASEPLTQAEVQRRLSISAGSASMTLAALVRWGVVHRVPVRGARREHYAAETDFWKMISGVLNERERKEIRAALETVRLAEAAARAGRAGHTRRRLERLRQVCELGEVMLDTLLGNMTLDVARFRDVLGTPENRS